jgi:sialate O-acetylesterase
MNDTWGVAKDPLHELAIAVDEAHAIIAGGPPGPRLEYLGVGPGVGFLQEMHRITGVPQGAIACAHGGTSMMQWDPTKKGEGGRSLYGAMLRRIAKNGNRVAGVFWYQGCSDADSYDAPLYSDRMVGLVDALRKDLRDRRLPWVVVQIATVVGDPIGSQYWNSVQEQQRLLPSKIRGLTVVPAVDLALDDGIHIAGYEQPRLGKRAAQAAALLRGEFGAGDSPIALKGARVVKNAVTGAADVVVTFDNVSGKLVSQGRPRGFALTQVPGVEQVPLVFRTDLEKNTAILHTVAPVHEVECTFVYYGLGRLPYCNVTDLADRSIPVFGPLYMGGNRVYAPFVTKLLVSRFMPSAGHLHDLAYPVDKSSLQLAPRQFEATFCSLHPEIMQAPVDDLLVYFAAPVVCNEDMDAEIWLGYDGPTKMWVDGAEKLFDPEGVNPALPDDSCTRVHLAAGAHEVLVALGSNNLKAWGIFLRLMRTGVPAETIVKGPEYYSVPKVVC